MKVSDDDQLPCHSEEAGNSSAAKHRGEVSVLYEVARCSLLGSPLPINAQVKRVKIRLIELG